MRRDRRERIGNNLSEYQKWVDYDMKKYGRISDITKGKIRRAGLSIVKDQYGDYEVIADRPIKERLKESESVGDKIFKLNSINLKDWYTKEFPDDELGYELNDDVDLRRCFSSLGRDPDIYDVMGVRDSVIRERVFAKMADVLGVDYDVIYYKWLGVNESLKESKELDRKLFMSLVKLGDNSWDGYSILNDGSFVKRIYADNDREAIRKFRDFLDKKNESCHGKNESCNTRKNRKLTERRWKYELKRGKELRDAIEDGDYDGILATLQMCYQELAGKGFIDQEDCDMHVNELDYIDTEDNFGDDEEYYEVEDEIDDVLRDFYDLCDDIGVWVSL